MTVLVLTHQFDPTADLVVRELATRGVPVFRCDASEFPERLRLSADLRAGWAGWLRTAHREVALESIGAAYYRKPSRFVFAEGMSATERRFATAEARLGFGGVLASLGCRWVNHPHRIATAEYKPLQLRVAAECGLRVPRTLITNDPDDARAFAASLADGMVYKPVSNGPGGEHGQPAALYTTIVPPEDYGHASIARTAHLFQEWVPKRCEVRVTVVARACFAVEIHVEGSPRAAVDWRADYASHRYEATKVPEGVRCGVAAVMDRLGLLFGAFDFVITPEGQWVFLEVNPNGQWAWLQCATGLPISAAIADVLEEGDKSVGEQGLLVDADPARVSELLQKLTEELAANGALRSPQWRAAFERTPRHRFVPRFYRRKPSGERELVDGARPEQHQAWLAGVYSDDALVTQYDQEDWRIATSSSTQPTLMALMLEALDVRDGHQVLEIGAGTGYNAALLCERLGSALVTTVDIDPGLVATARERLQQLGHTPTVAVADGAQGYPPNAPYDRIIATCAVASIPPAWIAQTRPGGLLLANLRGGWGDGLVRVEVLADGSAVGRFLPDPAAFIAMRGSRPPQPHVPKLLAITSGEGRSRPITMPNGIRDETFWFLAGLALPHAIHFGSPNTSRIYDAPRLVDLDDGSWSRVDRTPEAGFTVTQGGPRNLWDELEACHEQWLELGKPARERYGLTVTTDGCQHAWCGSPDSDHIWALPGSRS